MPQLSNPWNPGNKSPANVPVTLNNVPTWVRVGALTYASFATAAASNSVALFLIPAAAICGGIKQRIKAPFTGLITYTVSVGDIGVVDFYASAFDVTQAANSYALSSDFAGESLTAATQLYATAVCTGGSLNAATAGALDIFALLSVVK